MTFGTAFDLDGANCVCVSVSAFFSFANIFMLWSAHLAPAINLMIYAMRKGCLIHLIHFHAMASPARRSRTINQIIKALKYIYLWYIFSKYHKILCIKGIRS